MGGLKGGCITLAKKERIGWAYWMTKDSTIRCIGGLDSPTEWNTDHFLTECRAPEIIRGFSLVQRGRKTDPIVHFTDSSDEDTTHRILIFSIYGSNVERNLFGGRAKLAKTHQ
jgi:hypothetical protein